MKFVKLCMIIGLVASGTVYGDSKAVYSSAEIEKKNEETEQLLKSLNELKQLKNDTTSLSNNNEKEAENHKQILKDIESEKALIEDKLGLQEKADWKHKAYQVGKITLGSTLLAGGAILTGGTSAVITAALLKSGVAVSTTFQCGGIVGGLVSVKEIGTSLYKTGTVNFKNIVTPTLAKAATLGGIMGLGSCQQVESSLTEIVDKQASFIAQSKTAVTA